MRIGRFSIFNRRRVIGPKSDPYLIRWLIFRVPFFGIMLHKMVRSDYERALHDHPWDFLSLVLRGGYSEMTPFGLLHNPPGSFLSRPAEWRHRVILYQDLHTTTFRPCWTLVFIGPRKRKWGFWVGDSWCWWRKYNHDLAICQEDILWEEDGD